MKVIVFGGAGFVGSHVADALTEAGHDVIIYDLKKSPYLKPGQVSIVGDILDDKLVGKSMSGCDIVYNFAGIADIKDAKERPLETVRTNILGNTILLEAARANRIKRFVFASTIYVYSQAGSFYRSSKQACELIMENYHKQYGLNFTILRYGSLYGPRADEKNWIHNVLRQAILLNKVTREGDGEEVREYIHIYDAAKLSVDVLKPEYENQYVIIAGNQQMKIKDLLVMIKEMLENKIEIEYLKTDLPEHYEITPYAFSPKLAKRLMSNHYVDMGQGLLEIIKEIYKNEREYSPRVGHHS